MIFALRHVHILNERTAAELIEVIAWINAQVDVIQNCAGCPPTRVRLAHIFDVYDVFY